MFGTTGNRAAEINYPVGRWFTPTKSDTTDDPQGPFDGIFLDDATQLVVKFRDLGDVDVTLSNLAPGVVHRIAVKRIWNSVTTSAVKCVKIG